MHDGRVGGTTKAVDKDESCMSSCVCSSQAPPAGSSLPNCPLRASTSRCRAVKSARISAADESGMKSRGSGLAITGGGPPSGTKEATSGSSTSALLWNLTLSKLVLRGARGGASMLLLLLPLCLGGGGGGGAIPPSLSRTTRRDTASKDVTLAGRLDRRDEFRAGGRGGGAAGLLSPYGWFGAGLPVVAPATPARGTVSSELL